MTNKYKWDLYEYKHEGINIQIYKYTGKKLRHIKKNIEEAIDCVKENTIDCVRENIIEFLKENGFFIKVFPPMYLKFKIYLEFNDITESEKKEECNENFKNFKNFKKRLKRRGMYLWGKKYICVTKVTKSEEMKKVILHEIGHFLDYKGKFDLTYKESRNLEENSEDICIYKCQNKKFKEIFDIEGDGYSDDENYYNSKINEYFVECFARYLINYKGFCNEKKFSKTIRYIKEFINKINV